MARNTRKKDEEPPISTQRLRALARAEFGGDFEIVIGVVQQLLDEINHNTNNYRLEIRRDKPEIDSTKRSASVFDSNDRNLVTVHFNAERLNGTVSGSSFYIGRGTDDFSKIIASNVYAALPETERQKYARRHGLDRPRCGENGPL